MSNIEPLYTMTAKRYWLLAPVEEGKKCDLCFVPLRPSAYHLVVQVTEEPKFSIDLKTAGLICCDLCSDKAL